MVTDDRRFSLRQRGFGRVHGFYVKPLGKTQIHLDREHSVLVPGDWTPHGSWQHNDFMSGADEIVAQLLRPPVGGKPYQIGGMYLEFSNGLSPPISAPAFQTTDGPEYYANLASNPNADYLRVPLVATQLTSTDSTVYTLGNLLTFFAQTIGNVGVNGKPCTAGAGSVFYGGALVAFPNFADPTQDLLFSRFYFAGDNQLEQVDGSQIGLAWPIQFGP